MFILAPFFYISTWWMELCSSLHFDIGIMILRHAGFVTAAEARRDALDGCRVAIPYVK